MKAVKQFFDYTTRDYHPRDNLERVYIQNFQKVRATLPVIVTIEPAPIINYTWRGQLDANTGICRRSVNITGEKHGVFTYMGCAPELSGISSTNKCIRKWAEALGMDADNILERLFNQKIPESGPRSEPFMFDPDSLISGFGQLDGHFDDDCYPGSPDTHLYEDEWDNYPEDHPYWERKKPVPYRCAIPGSSRRYALGLPDEPFCYTGFPVYRDRRSLRYANRVKSLLQTLTSLCRVGRVLDLKQFSHKTLKMTRNALFKTIRLFDPLNSFHGVEPDQNWLNPHGGSHGSLSRVQVRAYHDLAPLRREISRILRVTRKPLE